MIHKTVHAGIKSSLPSNNIFMITRPGKYKYVVSFIQNIKYVRWYARIPGQKSIRCKTERDAAITVDKILIELDKDPINILKPYEKKEI